MSDQHPEQQQDRTIGCTTDLFLAIAIAIAITLATATYPGSVAGSEIQHLI